MVDVEKFLVTPDTFVNDVIACIDQNAKGIALVVDESRHLLGTITDGDIRRAILRKVDLSKPIQVLLVEKASTSYPEPITAPAETSDAALLSLMQEHVIQQVPLLEDGQVVDLAFLSDLLPERKLSLNAVVMAGGYGTRLRPLTEDLPKPMLPVGGQPVMELILEQLSKAGIRRVNISTHYLPEKIKEHFGDGKPWGVDLNYVKEERPLGTAGALGLMDAPDTPLLVINGDILTKVDFKAMLKYHRKHHTDLTVGVRQFDFEVPYGVLECDGPHVRQLKEKPKYNFLVNAGIYLLEPSVHQFIPTGQCFDMTDLIEILIESGHSVVSFPIMEYWLDIGKPADYKQAQEDLENGKV